MTRNVLESPVLKPFTCMLAVAFSVVVAMKWSVKVGVAAGVAAETEVDDDVDEDVLLVPAFSASFSSSFWCFSGRPRPSLSGSAIICRSPYCVVEIRNTFCIGGLESQP